MAAKFSKPQSVRLSCLAAMLEADHKLQPKPKHYYRVEGCTAADLDCLAAEIQLLKV